MSINKYVISEHVERILELVDHYGTQKAFLEVCEIQNHSFISDLKKGRNKNPGADVIGQIVTKTRCNGHWLLTGEGEMFEERQNPDDQDSDAHLIYKARQLMDKIESYKDELKVSELPADFELELAQLLVKVLAGRRDTPK